VFVCAAEIETSLTYKINRSGVVTAVKIRCRFWTAGSTPVRRIILVHVLLCNSASRYVNPLPKTIYSYKTRVLFYILLPVHLGTIRVNNQLDALFYAFISLLYMFRAKQCSSSGESIVSIHHLVRGLEL